jgi:hypothetical protein
MRENKLARHIVGTLSPLCFLKLFWPPQTPPACSCRCTLSNRRVLSKILRKAQYANMRSSLPPPSSVAVSQSRSHKVSHTMSDDKQYPVLQQHAEAQRSCRRLIVSTLHRSALHSRSTRLSRSSAAHINAETNCITSNARQLF